MLARIAVAALVLGCVVDAVAEDKLPPDKQTTSWTLSVDNDLFLGQNRDNDYTGGITFASSGPNSRRLVTPLSYLRRGIERAIGVRGALDRHEHFTLHAAEAGFVLFTPLDITIAEPEFDDHPYASIFFAVSSEQTVLPEQQLSFSSTFTLGFLGLSLAEDVQSGLHDIIDAPEPEGWDNQISAGGELTARYSFGVQKLVLDKRWQNQAGFEFKIASEASVGYVTGADVGFNLRFGRLSTPWWSFNPHQAEYANLGNRPTSQNREPEREFFFFAGAAVRLRLYNAILQGQFRDSVVEFDGDDVENFVFEGWTGASVELNRHWAVSAFLRTRTAELNKAIARSPKWAGFIFHRTFY